MSQLDYQPLEDRHAEARGHAQSQWLLFLAIGMSGAALPFVFPLFLHLSGFFELFQPGAVRKVRAAVFVGLPVLALVISSFSLGRGIYLKRSGMTFISVVLLILNCAVCVGVGLLLRRPLVLGPGD